MNSSHSVLYCCAVVGFCSLSGCASIISGREADVTINTNPPAAHVVVQNETGENIASAVTPATISLKRGRGFFKKAPRYVAKIEKQGYEPKRVAIRPKLNPWILGNVALGGVIGLAADSATGAMWRFTPDDIEQQLTPYQGPQYSQSQSGEVVQASHVAED